MAKKVSELKRFTVIAWTGTCFGVASAGLILTFSSATVHSPIVFSVVYMILSAALLAGGVLGFRLSRNVEKKKPRAKKRK